jgi:hypothetical protein
LYSNPIKTLHPHLIDNLDLRVFGASKFHFTSIPSEFFAKNVNIQKIELKGNISQISNKMFSTLKNLEVLDLRDNFCVIQEFRKHNTTVAYTEDILLPCSCKLKDVEIADSKLSRYLTGSVLVIGMVVILIIFLRANRSSEDDQELRQLSVFRKGKFWYLQGCL